MSLSGLIAITRPVNSVVAGIAGIVAYLIATKTIVPETFGIFQALLLFLIVLLITAAGNVINDYFDAEIDAINRPGRPIPSGAVSRLAAWRFAGVLFLFGILMSFFTNLLCLAITICNVLLLVAYAAHLKSTPFFGNAAVSYLAASIFLFGGALAGWNGIIHMLPIAAITFLAMLARELLKDAEDVKGDEAGGAVTLPIRIGIRSTARLAFFFALLAVAASIVPYLWWGQWYLAGILVVDCVIVAATLVALRCDTADCVKVSGSTTILKLGMFASLVIFTLSAVFL
jgi:geranylgeranylglycerol-phosphate geranylgeranyltransferase